MRLKQSQILDFQNEIFTWWMSYKRNLPWRETRNPYYILVSEIMLQQTQVSRVLGKYVEFVTAFPHIKDLADASSGSVLRIWKGMGYNRRALYLQQCARRIVAQYHGLFPKTESELLSLPGIGKYTARAILVFAFNNDIAAVDTNIRQIIIHHFFRDKTPSGNEIQHAADMLIPKGRSWEWHQALMDYGALELKKISIKNKDKIKKTLPFRESKRYVRGRIIDLLRIGEEYEKQLIEYITKTCQKKESEVKSIIEDLERDGLLCRLQTGIIRLPD